MSPFFHWADPGSLGATPLLNPECRCPSMFPRHPQSHTINQPCASSTKPWNCHCCPTPYPEGVWHPSRPAMTSIGSATAAPTAAYPPPHIPAHLPRALRHLAPGKFNDDQCTLDVQSRNMRRMNPRDKFHTRCISTRRSASSRCLRCRLLISALSVRWDPSLPPHQNLVTATTGRGPTSKPCGPTCCGRPSRGRLARPSGRAGGWVGGRQWGQSNTDVSPGVATCLSPSTSTQTC